MSAGRIVVAAFLGAIAMFVWTAIAHMATPLGTTGVKQIPNEAPVLAALQSSLGHEQGLYIYPGMGVALDAPRSEQQAGMANYQQKLDVNPSGILIYRPAGVKAMEPKRLIHEFLFQFLETLLLAILLSMTALSTIGGRVGFSILVGLIAAASTNLSYWNWYGFPSDYTHVAMFVETVKYLVAGAVIALLMRKSGGTTKTAAA